MIRVGMINDRERIIYQDNELVKDFLNNYKINKLVYFETAKDISSAIQREKEIKEFNREQKNELIESMNPKWRDLMTYMMKAKNKNL